MMDEFYIDVILSWPGIIKPYKAKFLIDEDSTDSIAPATELLKCGFLPRGKSKYINEYGDIREYEYTLAVFEIIGEMTSGRVIMDSNVIKPVIGIDVIKTAGFEIDYKNKKLLKKAIMKMKARL
jgi:hypothetical protein